MIVGVKFTYFFVIGLLASFLIATSYGATKQRSKTKKRTKSKHLSQGVTNSELSCPEKNGVFSYKKDCSKFIQCYNGWSFLKDCAPGTHFNAEISTCDWPYNTNCPGEEKAGGQQTSTKQVGQSQNKNKVNAAEVNRGKGSPSVGKKKVENKKRKYATKSGKTIGKYGTKTSRKTFKTPCLKPSGQFPYSKDCSKFVNCWKGRAILQSCPYGLLFDASSGKCGWPKSAICGSVIELEEDADKHKVTTPPISGQKIRFHGGNSFFAGYVQIFVDAQWLYIVVELKKWNLRNRICKQLGYQRGALSETRGMHYADISQEDGLSHVIDCRGDEKGVFECVGKNVSYESFSTDIVGLRCRKDSASECPLGWHRWGAKCYYVEAKERVSHKRAKKECASKSAILVSIPSQVENDFISDLLKLSKVKTGFHTGGNALKIHDEMLWMWEDMAIPRSNELTYTNWWRGWSGNDSESSTSPNVFCEGLSIQCVSLHMHYYAKQMDSDFSADYYFWKLDSCNIDLHYVCEREKLDIGCVEDRGQTYNGTANVTTSGSPCLQWNQLGGAFRRLKKLANLRENYCVNPDDDNHPWCFVAGGTTEFCNIPRCPVSEMLIPEVSNCESGMFSCSTGECIHTGWLCDGKKDCPEGEDESDDKCPDYADLFQKRSGFRLEGEEVETWYLNTKSACEIHCALAKNFICYSFNYEEATGKCVLSRSNAGKSGGLIRDFTWEYHERKDLRVDCSHSFNCTDYKCIKDNQICDGHHDCQTGEDEDECIKIEEFEVRLANGSDLSEGRVEVKVQGQWGRVCDDMWGMEEGHVVCRQLGFMRGAKMRTTDSYFGDGEGPFFIDDANCDGHEESLALCDFAGWGQSDCDVIETAGVICLLDHEPCAEHQLECENGHCIPIEYYCDSMDDCEDGSDERKEQCSSPLEVRLAPPDDPLLKVSVNDAVGRVEILYKGLWGSICDDDATIEVGHVICRMLGYKGAISVFKNNTFGPGSGPIWLDGLRCLGNEKSLEQCHHQPWGENNCDHNEDLGVHCTTKILSNVHLESSSTGNSHLGPLEAINLPMECGFRFVEDTPNEILASPRLVEGYVPRAGAHPWMAGLRRRKTVTTSVHQCGAFIISSDLVLTAAHCVITHAISDYFIRTGDFNNEEEDVFEEEWNIEQMVRHEEYDRDVDFNNDLAILKIKRNNGRSIKFNERVQPLCLPPQKWHYPAWQNCTVAGWGTTTSIGRSRLLLSTALPILPDSICRSEHVYRSEDISAGMFCAGYLEGGIDTCQGDSGGPLVCPINGHHTAIGIISWGHGCAKANKPGVYTKLTHYIEWIHNKVQLLQS